MLELTKIEPVLAGISLAVDFAESSPFAEGLIVSDLKNGDLVFAAKSLHKSHVVGLVAVLSQKTMKINLKIATRQNI